MFCSLQRPTPGGPDGPTYSFPPGNFPPFPGGAPVEICEWTKHTAPDGKKYYYNTKTAESVWEKPKELIEFEQRQPGAGGVPPTMPLATLMSSYQSSNSETAKKSASEKVQIDAIVTKTPKVRQATTNQETRQVAVQLNTVDDNENVASEPCCAPTNQPICNPEVWVYHDIETTIRARKCRNPCRILKWIIHLIFWLGCYALIGGVIGGAIGGSLYGIGYLFYTGAPGSIFFGIVALLFFLLGLCLFDRCFECGVCHYFSNGHIN